MHGATRLDPARLWMLCDDHSVDEMHEDQIYPNSRADDIFRCAMSREPCSVPEIGGPPESNAARNGSAASHRTSMAPPFTFTFTFTCSPRATSV